MSNQSQGQNNDHPEKLSERMEIRLHYSVKQRFLAACRRTGDVPSDVLRAAMKGYIETVEAAEQPSLTKELSMKLIHNPLKTLAALGTSVAAAVMFTATPSIAEDRDAIPNNPPTVYYPVAMVVRGITGECEAIFDVSSEGVPENIRADCTHPGFVKETIKSATTLRFSPKIEDEKPVKRVGVAYPLIFQFSDDEKSAAEEGEASPEEIFKRLDENSDGILNDTDLSDYLLEQIDLNGDGNIPLIEFTAFIDASKALE